MNIPIQVLKANSTPPSSMFNNHQSLGKKYSQLFKKKFQTYQTIQAKSDGDPEKEKKIHQILKCSQEDVIKWFFSLDLRQRLKICSIENKWLITIIYQMCKHTLLDERIKFKMNPSYNKEKTDELLPSLIYTNNSITASLINVNMNNLHNLSLNEASSLNNYLHYFTPNNYIQTNINLEKFLNYNEKMEKGFFRELKLFQKNEISDTICLSLALLSNESLFIQFFSYFTNDKFFRSYIGILYDNQNKFYNFNFPLWINSKEYFSFFQWVISFFEQNILIWYFLYKNLNHDNFEALMLDDKLYEILEENEKMIKFLKNHSFSSISDKKKFFNKINFKSISIEIRKDEKIAQMISLKKKYVDIVNQCCSNNILYFQNLDKRTVLEILEDAEIKIKDQLFIHSEEVLIEYLFFSTVEKIFSYDDFLKKKIWGEIHNLYTTQNALDLIMEELLLSSSEYKNSSPNRKNSFNQTDGPKKKNNSKKRNKNNTKRNQKEDSNNVCPEKNKNIDGVNKEKNETLSDDILKSLQDLIARSENIAASKNTNKKKEINNENEPSKNSDDESANNQTNLRNRNKIKRSEKKSFFLYSTIKKSTTKDITTNNISDVKYRTTQGDDISEELSKDLNENSFCEERIVIQKKNSTAIKEVNHVKRIISPEKETKRSNLVTVKETSDIAVNLKISLQEDRKKNSVLELKETSKIVVDKRPSSEKDTKEYNTESINETIEKPRYKNLENKENKLTYENLTINNENVELTLKSESDTVNLIPLTTVKESSEININIDEENSAKNKSNLNITINSPIYNNYYIMDRNYSNDKNKNNTDLINYNENNISIDNYSTVQSDNINYKTLSPAKIKSISTIPTHFNDSISTCSTNINPQIFSYQNPFATQEIYKKFNQLNLLHSNIINYSKEVSENTSCLKEIKHTIIRKIEELVKNNLSEYEINFAIYGSFATDLAIESSDIDITVNYWPKDEDKINSSNKAKIPTNVATEIIINKIVNILYKKNNENKSKIFDLINPIYTASVPVIKLHIDVDEILDNVDKQFFQEFKSTKNYCNYRFKIEDLDKIKVDLTFSKNKSDLNNNMNIYENPALQVVDYIRNSLVYFPEIKFLMYVVKRILKIAKLNSSYNGGLSSFCLFILTSAFLKMRKFNMNMIISPNFGSTLLEFLEFYSKFNFSSTFIDVNSYNPFVYVIEGLEQIPLILDPITYLNAGKSIFRIVEIQKCFAYIVNLFHSDSLQEPNLIHSLFEHLNLRESLK